VFGIDSGSCRPKNVSSREMAGEQTLVQQIGLGSFSDARRTQ
jgi:hypothetical protein